MPFRISSKHIAFFFALGVFIVFPCLNFSCTLDPETLWRIVALGVVLLPCLFYYYAQSLKGKQNLFPFLNSKVIVFFSLYIAVSALSLMMAVNPGDGLFDVLKLFMYLIALIIITQLIIESKENLDIIIKCINVSVILFSVFGWIQFMDLLNDARDFNKAFIIGQSIKSTLSNKNTYSEVLFLCFPFCLYGMVEYKKAWRYLGLFNSLLIILSIGLLMNLYVWLALILSGVVLLFFLIRNKEISKKQARILSIITIGVLCISALAFIKFSNIKVIRSKVSHVLNYVKHPESIGQHDRSMNDNNIHERLVLIKNSLKMIKENWGFGVGVSNWKIYQPKYGPVSITSNIRLDYPHNDYLSVFAETGIIGIACYVAFLFFAMKTVYRINKNSTDPKLKKLSLLMLFGIFGFTVISFFGFAKEKFFPMLLLMIIVAIVLSNQKETSKKESNGSIIRKSMLFGFIVIILLLMGVGVKRITGEVHLQKALKAKKFKRWNTMSIEAAKVYSCFYPVDYSATPVHWYQGIACFYDNKLDSALMFFKQAEPFNPYHVQLLNDIGTCYELKSDHSNAITYFKKAFELDPYLVRENLIAAYFNSGQLDKALNLACDNRFEKTVFLEEILRAKAMSVYDLQKVNNETLLEKINTKEWLLTLFERSKSLKVTFEEAIRDEIEP